MYTETFPSCLSTWPARFCALFWFWAKPKQNFFFVLQWYFDQSKQKRFCFDKTKTKSCRSAFNSCSCTGEHFIWRASSVQQRNAVKATSSVHVERSNSVVAIQLDRVHSFGSWSSRTTGEVGLSSVLVLWWESANRSLCLLLNSTATSTDYTNCRPGRNSSAIQSGWKRLWPQQKCAPLIAVNRRRVLRSLLLATVVARLDRTVSMRTCINEKTRMFIDIVPNTVNIALSKRAP